MMLANLMGRKEDLVSAHTDENSSNKPVLTWGRAILYAFGWQLITAGWLMWDAWDSPSTQTLYLRAAVFLLVPVLSGLVHRSWRVSVAALLLPVFAIGVMMTIFMLIMPTGKW
jgi:hypothetical protein